MKTPRRILFVCSLNQWRSPTAEHVFADYPGVETASAGTHSSAAVPVSIDLLDWADDVLVMEASHRADLNQKFGAALKGKRLVVLGVNEPLPYMDPQLVEILNQKVRPYLPPASNAR